MSVVNDETTKYLFDWIYGILEPKLKKSDTWKFCQNARKESASVTAHLKKIIKDTVCGSKDKPFLLGEDNRLYVYNGRFFEQTESGYLEFLLESVLTEAGANVVYCDGVPKKAVANCLNTMRYKSEFNFVPDRRYICFRNGVLDLDDCKLKGFSMDYRTDIVLDFDYASEKELYRDYSERYGIKREVNPARLWEWKIEEIIPNKEMRDAFQQYCGTFLLKPDERPQFICYLYGNGGNGKSVVADVIAAVFGEEHFSYFTLEQLLTPPNNRVNLASLRYKIANFIGDLSLKDMSGGNFKNFVSGGKFEARWNGENKIFTVRAVPLLACANDIPMSRDDSEGHHRRSLVIHTTTKQWTEEDRDPLLTRKLTTEDARRYIFTWILAGMQMIKRNGGNLKLGKAVLDAQERLKIQSNSMRMWWNDYDYRLFVPAKFEAPTVSGAEYVLFSKIYDDYKRYCEEYGYKPENKNKLGHMLSNQPEVIADTDKNIVKRKMDKGFAYLLIKKEVK